MQTVMKPVDMIAVCSNGVLTPYRFRMQGSEAEIVVNILEIKSRQEEKLAGNRMFIYLCKGIIEDVERLFELKYEINTCRWFLFRIK